MSSLIDAFRGPLSKETGSIRSPGSGSNAQGVSKPGKSISTGRSPENSDSMMKRFMRESRVRLLKRETLP